MSFNSIEKEITLPGYDLLPTFLARFINKRSVQYSSFTQYDRKIEVG